MLKKNIFLVVLLFLHLFLLLNLQFTIWPEMFSFPYMVNSGFLIYKDFHHAYQPLLTIILSLIYKLFGYDALVLKIFTYSLILSTDILIFAVCKKIGKNNLLSILPVAVFVVFQPVFEGNAMWFDLATVPLILASIYMLLYKKFLFSGVLISLGILTKQQSVLLLLPIILYFLIIKINKKELLHFALGVVLPVAAVIFWILYLGIFEDYLFWTFYFPLKYLPLIPGYASFPSVKQLIIFLGLLLPIFISLKRFIKVPEFIFIFALLFFSILTSLPRFSLFHLQLALAIYSLSVGYIVIKSKNYFYLFLPLVIALMFWRQNAVFVKEDKFYGGGEKRLAQLVSGEINKDETVYFLGTHSLVYVLADRIPPKPWIENYVWHFEIPGIEKKLIDSWNNNPPSAVLWTEPQTGNWFDLGVYQPKGIVEWVKVNYNKEAQLEPGVWLWRKK